MSPKPSACSARLVLGKQSGDLERERLMTGGIMRALGCNSLGSINMTKESSGALPNLCVRRKSTEHKASPTGNQSPAGKREGTLQSSSPRRKAGVIREEHQDRAVWMRQRDAVRDGEREPEGLLGKHT